MGEPRRLLRRRFAGRRFAGVSLPPWGRGFVVGALARTRHRRRDARSPIRAEITRVGRPSGRIKSKRPFGDLQNFLKKSLKIAVRVDTGDDIDSLERQSRGPRFVPRARVQRESAHGQDLRLRRWGSNDCGEREQLERGRRWWDRRRRRLGECLHERSHVVRWGVR